MSGWVNHRTLSFSPRLVSAGVVSPDWIGAAGALASAARRALRDSVWGARPGDRERGGWPFPTRTRLLASRVLPTAGRKASFTTERLPESALAWPDWIGAPFA